MITKFLQEASRIVPMESIFFAIANCNSNDTALKCADALIQNILPSQIPASSLMLGGCDQAFIRLNYIAMKKAWFMQPQLWGKHQKSYSDAVATKIVSGISDQTKVHTILPSKATMLAKIFSEIVTELKKKNQSKMRKGQLNVVSGRNIGEVYPISKALVQTKTISALAPLPDILKVTRHTLRALADSQTAEIGSASVHNDQMLRCVNGIIENSLKPCVTMLGGFMEQQIRVPLVDNPFDTALALTASFDTEAVGVWALFALRSEDILDILSKSKNQSLIVQIEKYIEGIFNRKSNSPVELDMNYAGKLQFLIQAMDETVTCSSQYISYSLERELVSLCKKLNINTSTKTESVILNWDETFKNTALCLVPETHRPLLARWLIWSLSINHLREGLAKYITIGIIGLVNSGKSTLVKRLFKIQV